MLDKRMKATHDSLQVLGARMALSDSGITLPQEGAHGGTDNVGTAEDNDGSAREVGTGAVDELDDTGRGAWSEEGLGDARREMTDVFRVEA